MDKVSINCEGAAFITSFRSSPSHARWASPPQEIDASRAIRRHGKKDLQIFPDEQRKPTTDNLNE